MEINKNTKLKHYAFPSIGQLIHLVATVNRVYAYVGRDKNDEPIYDKSLSKPKLKFIGTTKLHGTNAGVIIDKFNDLVYYESRESVITPESDNAGFARYMSTIQTDFVKLILDNLNTENIDWENNIIAVYGEWCGGSIQKNVALNSMEKMFVIFSITIRTRESTDSRNLKWLSVEETKQFKLVDKKIHNIYDFKTWEIEIDFEKTHNYVNQIVDWTIEVEDLCPFAKEFGIEGIGEGIVFRCINEPYNNSDYWFKSKGEKHSKSKVKTILPVDDEKINRLISIAEEITPSWRLEQMFNLTFDTLNGGFPTREKLGNYIRAVTTDIQKEENLKLEQEGITFKDVGKFVSKITTDYFFMMEKEMIQ